MLKKMLTTPPIKKIDLVFPLGLEVTARNLRGVTIKDALDAIYKQFKKKVRFRHSKLLAHRDGRLTSFPVRRRDDRPLPQRLRVGPRGVLHALHRTPEEDRRRTFRRRQEEEEGWQGRGDLLGDPLQPKETTHAACLSVLQPSLASVAAGCG